jgi:hypothetical protein
MGDRTKHAQVVPSGLRARRALRRRRFGTTVRFDGAARVDSGRMRALRRRGCTNPARWISAATRSAGVERIPRKKHSRRASGLRVPGRAELTASSLRGPQTMERIPARPSSPGECLHSLSQHANSRMNLPVGNIFISSFPGRGGSLGMVEDCLRHDKRGVLGGLSERGPGAIGKTERARRANMVSP